MFCEETMRRNLLDLGDFPLEWKIKVTNGSGNSHNQRMPPADTRLTFNKTGDHYLFQTAIVPLDSSQGPEWIHIVIRHEHRIVTSSIEVIAGQPPRTATSPVSTYATSPQDQATQSSPEEAERVLGETSSRGSNEESQISMAEAQEDEISTFGDISTQSRSVSMALDNGDIGISEIPLKKIETGRVREDVKIAAEIKVANTMLFKALDKVVILESPMSAVEGQDKTAWNRRKTRSQMNKMGA
ncbi:MAG: hypothetical protein Q9209_005834 [Squamulea sp. 1 TL-2023]